MGELHLEIYVERMRREYNVDCTTGKPRVAFRETITQAADFAYTHKKQTGGAGQFARVVGTVEPMEFDEESGKDIGFENLVMGGNIPQNYIPACEKVSSWTRLKDKQRTEVDLRRASTRPWRRAPSPATQSVVLAWFSGTVPSTPSIPPNWPSVSLSWVPSAKST